MSKYISYESWEKDFFTIPNLPELESFMDRHCITDPHKDTASLLIFRQGGYIEQFKDGTYFVTLDRSDIYDKDVNVVKRALYNWCDGEEFNYHNGFKFGEYKSQNGCIWDLKEFAILSDAWCSWLDKEGLPQSSIEDLLGTFDWSVGYELTDSQRETARSFEKMWNLVDEKFTKGDSPNA